MAPDGRNRVQRPAPQPEPHQPFHVLLPVSDLGEAKVLLPMAEFIVKERQGQLTILAIKTVPPDKALSAATAEASRLREALSSFLGEEMEIPTQLRTMVRAEKDIWDGVWDFVTNEQTSLLLLCWNNPNLPETTFTDLVNDRLHSPPCDVVAVHPAAGFLDSQGWRSIQRILLPVRGGANSTLTLRIGHAIARFTNATITLLHVTRHGNRDAEMQFFDEFSPALHGLEHITRSVTTKGEISHAVLAEANDHQVVVMGAPSRQSPGEGWHGPLVDAISQLPKATLILVKEYKLPVEMGAPAEIESPIMHPSDRPVAVVVDNWFAENTYHSREFADLRRLLNLKEDQGLTISLGLPALNEEATVGNVIKSVKQSLMDDIPLLDEIVLIDSGSVDYTRDIATDLGIPVYIHQEILPQYRSYKGKGEALWKSLHVLKGDIIAWIDTDIKNIHPRFVYGVLGPILHDPHVKYVKGFYRRPLRQGEKLVAGGGGRVTEITARPFFNLFFPELSGLIQPLSGEYAGRRDALERLPFFTGYGVETGLLIDFLNEYGLNAIAQVDLLERIHHNQPLPSLSKMSFTIMQVVFKRLEERHNIRMLDDANLTMNLIRYGPNRYFLEPQKLRERERPPIITIPEYRADRDIQIDDFELEQIRYGQMDKQGEHR
jgi:glycosyltransferase involved in cell wall biosynthesis